MKEEQKDTEKEKNNNNKKYDNINNRNNQNITKNDKKTNENNSGTVNTLDNGNNNYNINSISLTKPSIESETKIINNTTNINIININNQTNNIFENDNNSTENYNNDKNNSNPKNQNEKDIKGINKTNNFLMNKNLISKVNKDNQKDIPKNSPGKSLKNQNLKNINVKTLNNNNNNIFTNNISRSLNLNNSLYNFPLGSQKFLSLNKFLKLSDYQNVSIMNKFPNLITISLSQGKTKKINKAKNNNFNYNNSPTYDSYRNNTNKKNSINYNSNRNSNMMDSSQKNKNNNKSNNKALLCKTYLEGYKTFFSKNKSTSKYNYDINTSYFKEEAKKYNNNSLKNYNNNVIDENDEYVEHNNSESNMKSVYNNTKYFKKTDLDKKDAKLNTKYKYNNNIFGKMPVYGKFVGKKTNEGYGTLYNLGYANKKKDVELPQLIQMYNNKNTKTINKNSYSYYGNPYNK
jgi:hypothetical protein